MKTQYKPSIFNVYSILDIENVLVYNTLTQGAISAEKNLVKIIKEESSKLELNYIEYLLKQEILVPFDLDEKENLFKLFKEVNDIQDSLDITICTTTKCNMKCLYCYEETIKETTLTPQIIKNITIWLQKYIQDNKIEILRPLLFGGEPLLAKDQMYELMRSLNKMTETLGKKCVFSIGTNGILLTRETVLEMKEQGLVHAMVTIDGPEKDHNRRRPWVLGGNSFEVIISNLKNIVDLINVTLKLNIDKDNINSIKEIFEILERYNLKDSIDIKIEAIAVTPASQTVPNHFCRLYAFDPQKAEMAYAYLKMINLAEEKGFKVHRSTAHSTPCMFPSKSGFALDPEGNIYKCISAIGVEEFKVGNVSDESFNGLYHKAIKFLDLCDSCFDKGCPFVPKCGGGCAYDSFCSTGEIFVKDCKREFIETFYTNFFKNIYYKTNKTR